MDVRTKIQNEALKALEKAHKDGKNQGLIVMATGLGKTRVAALDVKAYLKKHKDARVLFICHNGNILLDARDRFKELFGDSYSYGFFCNAFEKCEKRVDFLSATFQTMVKDKKKFKPDTFDYIIVDECHHAKADGWEKVATYFKPKFILGLTATPDRMDKRDITEIFGEPTFEKDLYEAIREGLLSNVEYRLILDDIEALLDVVNATNEEKLTLGELNKKVFVPKRDEEIVKLIKAHSKGKKNPRTMIFCSSIEHAENIAKLIKGSKVVHSMLPQKVNQENLNSFKNGSLRTIISVDKLNEGVDIPETDVVVFLRNSGSKTIIQQQLGRGLRPVEGKDNVLVLDFVSNCERLLEFLTISRQAFNGKKRNPTERNKFIVKLGSTRFEANEIEILEYLKRAKELSEKYNKIWSEEEAIQMLIDLGEKTGKTPTLKMIDDDPDTPCIKTYYIGSFNNALKAAGFEPNCERVSKDEVLQCLIDFKNRTGKTPTCATVDADSDMPSAMTYIRFFGSFNNALKAAGFEPNQKERKKVAKEEALQKLIDLGKKTGKTPTLKMIDNDPDMPTVHAYVGLFGSFNNALKAAGFELNYERKKTPKEEALQKLIDLGRKTGKTPTQKMVDNDPDMPCKETYRKLFGSFNNALKAAGFEPSQKKVTKEEALQYLINFGERTGKTPTCVAVDADSDMPSVKTYRRLFGSFNNALKSAGFEPNLKYATEEELLQCLIDLGKKTGKTPTLKMIDNDPEMPSSSTFKKFFGSFSNALKAAGFEPNKGSPKKGKNEGGKTD